MTANRLKAQRDSGPWPMMLGVGDARRVLCLQLSAENLVFTLELIQAHKMSNISTQQMHLRDYTLEGDSLHKEQPPPACGLQQVPPASP